MKMTSSFGAALGTAPPSHSNRRAHRTAWHFRATSPASGREGELALLRRRARQRSWMAIPEGGARRAATSLGQREPSLLSVLVQTGLLIVAAWLVIVYVLPALFELSAAPYR